MKSLNTYLNEEKKTTGAGCVDMVKTILDQLTKEHSDCTYDKEKDAWTGKDADLWKGAARFLYDYLQELSNLDIEDGTIIKQVSYVLIRLINEFDYLINNLNETSLNRLREIFNNLYKFTTIDNKFTNRLKSTIDERLNRLNSLDLSTKEL